MGNILIVDDSSDITESLSDLLIECGHKVYIAHSAAEGLSIAFRILPDLILSDILMPRKDGYEVLRGIRDNEATSHIPLIFISAKTEKSEIQRALEAGANEYIRKPYDAKELLKAVSETLKKHNPSLV